MSKPCENCDRVDCPTLLPSVRSALDHVNRERQTDCRAHTVNWRTRAIELRAELAEARQTIEVDQTRLADAALAECAKAAEEAWKEAAVECRCERVCDCKTCNTYSKDSWQSSDTRKKWAKEGGE